MGIEIVKLLNNTSKRTLKDLLKCRGQKSKESTLQQKSCLKSNVNFNVKRSELEELKNSERRTRKTLNEFSNTKLRNSKKRKDVFAKLLLLLKKTKKSRGD